jgi:hypothetical protein
VIVLPIGISAVKTCPSSGDEMNRHHYALHRNRHDRIMVRLNILIGMITVLCGIQWLGWGFVFVGSVAIFITVSLILVDYYKELLFMENTYQ